MPAKRKAAKRASGGKAKSHHRAVSEPLAVAVGAKIRARRKELDISFDALVGLTGLGRGYVSEVERGLALPSIGTLLRVADALRIPPAQLLVRDRATAGLHERLSSVAAELSTEALGELLAYAEKLLEQE